MDTLREAERIVELTRELTAGVGDDETLIGAAKVAAMWAVFEDSHVYEPVAPERLCRRGLIGGRADELEWLEESAERMEQVAVALRRLIAHTRATHPLARQRARRRALAVS